eukprot:m.374917 g.374917  ORF g.374917 m.374917 type:complete len:862 (-) comp28176_c0_seq2:1158-3743(-)
MPPPPPPHWPVPPMRRAAWWVLVVAQCSWLQCPTVLARVVEPAGPVVTLVAGDAQLSLNRTDGSLRLAVGGVAVLSAQRPAQLRVSDDPTTAHTAPYSAVTSVSPSVAVAAATVAIPCGATLAVTLTLRVVDTYSVCDDSRAAPPLPVRPRTSRGGSDLRGSHGFGWTDRVNEGAGGRADYRNGPPSAPPSFCLNRSVTVLTVPSPGCSTGFLSLFALRHVSPEPSLGVFVPGVLYGTASPPWAIGGSATDLAVMAREDRAAAPVVAVVDAVTGTMFSLMRAAGDVPNTILNDTLTAAPITDARMTFGSLGFLRDPALAPAAPAISIGWAYPGSEWGRSYLKGAVATGGLWRFHPLVPGVSHRTHLVLGLARTPAPPGTPTPELLLPLIGWAWAWADALYNPAVRTDIDLGAALAASVGALSAMYVDPGQPIAGVPSGALKDTGVVYSSSLQMGFVGPQFREAYGLLWWGLNGSRPSGGAGGHATAVAQAKRMIDGWVSSNGGDGSGLSHTNWDLNLQRWCDDDGMWSCAHPNTSATRKVYLRREVVGHWHTLDAWALLNRTTTNPADGRPAWRAAAVQFGQWLVRHQAANGSWPRALTVTASAHSGVPASTSVSEPSTTATAIPIRLLVELWRVTGNASFLGAATAAGSYAWEQYGRLGLYQGAALDNPDVVDKESALFALDGFLALAEAAPSAGAGRNDTVWMDRAASAAVVAASWHRITDVPNPVDAASAMDWAAGDTACGLGLIALGHSGSDTFGSMFAASFAAVAEATGTAHLGRMARLQAYNTKQPMDLDGTKRYYLRGFMSELFSFSVGWNVFTSRNDGRGIGDPHWVPWVSANSAFGLTRWFETQPPHPRPRP